MLEFNPLSANPTKWSNTLKRFVGNLPTNWLSVFNHFVGLAPKELRALACWETFNSIKETLKAFDDFKSKQQSCMKYSKIKHKC